MVRIPVRACSSLLAVAALAALATLVAVPAAAETFHLKLKNGTLIDSRYQPVQATWDPNVVLLLNDEGNWIGIQQQDIEAVDKESQVRGFGVSLNFNTVAIGWAPNDLPEPGAPAPGSTAEALQNLALQQSQATAHYTVPQFVQPEQASGIPPAFVGGYRALPQVPQPYTPPPPAPTPTPAPAPAPPRPSSPSHAAAGPSEPCASEVPTREMPEGDGPARRDPGRDRADRAPRAPGAEERS